MNATPTEGFFFQEPPQLWKLQLSLMKLFLLLTHFGLREASIHQEIAIPFVGGVCGYFLDVHIFLKHKESSTTLLNKKVHKDLKILRHTTHNIVRTETK